MQRARGEPLPGIERDPGLDEAVFTLAMGGVSAPVKTRSGYAVVKAVDRIPAGVPPLTEIKPRVIEAIKRERAETMAMARAKELVASLDKGGVLLAALQTPAGRVSEPVRTGAAVYVVKTLERQAPDPQSFDRQRVEIEKQTLEQKRSEVWDSWVQARRAAAKVDIAGLATPATR